MYKIAILHQLIAILPVFYNNLFVGMNFAWSSSNMKFLLSDTDQIPFTYKECMIVALLLHIGRIVGTMLNICVLGKFGRKIPFLFGSSLFLTSALLVLTEKSVPVLCFSRFISGIAVSITEGFNSIYIGEVSSKSIRGMTTTFGVLTFNLGILSQYVLGTYFEYYDAAKITLTLAIFLLLSCYCAVETPYYLASIGNTEKALSTLCWLRASTVKQVENEFHEITRMDMTMNFREILLHIKQPEVRRSFAMTILLQLIITTLMSAFASFANFLIPDSPQLSSEQFALILNIIPVAMGLLSSFCLDRFGRRPLLIVSFTLELFLNAAITVMFYVQEKSIGRIPHFSYIVFVFIVVYLTIFTFATQPSVIALRSEVLPQGYKVLGINITFCMSASLYLALIWLFMESLELYGMYINFLVYFMCCFVGLVFVAYNVPETKGRTLAQIQDILKKS